jgi:hypothetical protein
LLTRACFLAAEFDARAVHVNARRGEMMERFFLEISQI